MFRQFFLSISAISVLGVSACQPNNQTPSESKAAASPSNVIGSPLTQSAIDTLARQLNIEYHLVSNMPDEKCSQSRADGKCFHAQLRMTAKQDIQAGDWALYFSHINRIQSEDSAEFDIAPVNGVLHKISLTEKFSGFKAGETKVIEFRADNWSLSLSDVLPNYIVAADSDVKLYKGIRPRVIQSTRWHKDVDTGLSLPKFAHGFVRENMRRKINIENEEALVLVEDSELYQRYNGYLALIANDKEKTAADSHTVSLIPKPKTLTQLSTKPVIDLSAGITIDYGNVEKHTVSAAFERIASFGVGESKLGVSVRLSQKPLVDTGLTSPESYRLVVDNEGIVIEGSDATGVFYGVQSIAGLVALDQLTLPKLLIEDEPHYGFRGMLVDVSRNFRSQGFILKLLDQMAAYKLNKLHLHLADDEGWRLEIPGLAELTDIGSKRCFDLLEDECLLPQLGATENSNDINNGYYSVAQYQQILKAASARHIQVLPSLDMPGHARAAVVSMAARYRKYMAQEEPMLAKQYLLHDEQDTTQYESIQYYTDNTLNVCQQSTFDFIDKVMDEVKQMHQAAGQPLTRYHIGADETAGAWLESPKCIDFIANNSHGITQAKELGAYFVERVSHLLADKGIEVAAWSDGLEHTKADNMPAVVQANAWHPVFWDGHKVAHELANRNWQTVVSSPDALYFDFPYQAHPHEHGYYWASRQTDTMQVFELMPDNLPAHAEFWLDRNGLPFSADDRVQKDKAGKLVHHPLKQGNEFVGVQGQFWGENSYSDSLAEYKIFPRIFALAERAWHSPEWAIPYNYEGAKYGPESQYFTTEKQRQRAADWHRFSRLIGEKELAKLERSNVNYRLPVVSFERKGDYLSASVPFSGLGIEYRINGKAWQIYSAPIRAKDESVEFRVRTRAGDRYSRVSQYQP